MLCPICNHENSAAATVCAACGTPLATMVAAADPLSVAEALSAGTALQDGAFIVGTVLGQGGFGITYLGQDTRLRRPVAIKEFFPAGCVRQGCAIAGAVAGLEQAKIHFLQEGQTLARFNHPGIVRVLTTFAENNTAYMVMEHLEGKSLAAVLVENGGPLSEWTALNYIEHIGAALEAVHEAGLLHRDIKPENVMVCSDGRVVLVDFGSAREFATDKTKRMTTLLTPGYAPPEQYGQHQRFGVYTDVYGLAATLYHLLTGEPPVTAMDRAAGVELQDVRHCNPRVGEAVALAITEGLRMEVSRRPQSARAFLDRLRGRAGLPAVAVPGSTFYQAPPAPPSAGGLPAGDTVNWGRGSGPPAEQSQHPAGQSPGGPRSRTTLLRAMTWHHSRVTSVAFSPDGHYLASASGDSNVSLWEAPGGRWVAAGSERPTALAGGLWGARYRPAVGGTNDVPAMLSHDASSNWKRSLRAHENTVTALAFSPDGTLLATGSYDKTVRLWDVRSGALRWTLRGHHKNVTAVAFSPDGHTLATGSFDKTVRLWKLEGGTHSTDARAIELRGVLMGHEGGVTALAFSPDGAILASASVETTVKLWNWAANVVLQTLTEHSSAATSVAFSPDGELLASGSYDKTTCLWDGHTGVLRETLGGHHDFVFAVAFSPDGELLASGSSDETITVWDARPSATRRAPLQIFRARGKVTSVAFTPDGRTLASGRGDGVINLWRLDLPSLSAASAFRQ